MSPHKPVGPGELGCWPSWSWNLRQQNDSAPTRSRKDMFTGNSKSFFDLPRELRDMVYDYVIYDRSVTKNFYREKAIFRGNIYRKMLVNKQMRSEILARLARKYWVFDLKKPKTIRRAQRFFHIMGDENINHMSKIGICVKHRVFVATFPESHVETWYFDSAFLFDLRDPQQFSGYDLNGLDPTPRFPLSNRISIVNEHMVNILKPIYQKRIERTLTVRDMTSLFDNILEHSANRYYAKAKRRRYLGHSCMFLDTLFCFRRNNLA
ncbi:uncharacterized protein K452DRAFT_338299 [Aplosporella prunicola CBS 121167]|uniref:Uncharacterized protein n=1 Tax=Aplosporella prunicola CBS 121167 TaxID=1176127 RepID=A0A6A6B4N7_9PEZI|nr:uncharacterized protein K452DRAFT_338299 [Aplosporella prunicola CBS 121167]KAF2138816.1 hypothetical protein K452DRAFT_338299 [Aplosporella prunicola CBS 121167]